MGAGVLNWGWYPTDKKWLPLKVDEHGSIVIACTVDELNDIGDVDVAAPTDLYILYWNNSNSKWECRALSDWTVPAHKNRHDPNDGADKLDTAAPVKVGSANAIGTSHSFPRADHVHEREHAKYLNSEAVAAVKAGVKLNELQAPDGAVGLNGQILDNIGAPSDAGDALRKGTALTITEMPANIKPATITFIIDGGGSAITTGEKGHLEIPFACTINQVTMIADQSGSIVVDIWKDTYANAPPDDADSITASAPPTLSSAQKSQDTTLTDWTTAITADDILAFNVDSCTTITRVTISLKVTKT